MVGFQQQPEGRKAVNLAAFRPCQEKSNSNPVGTSLCHAPRTVAQRSSPRATTQESVGERAISDKLLDVNDMFGSHVMSCRRAALELHLDSPRAPRGQCAPLGRSSSGEPEQTAFDRGGLPISKRFTDQV